MCGHDGALGNVPAGLEAAHIRWHSQGGPDAAENGLALLDADPRQPEPSSAHVGWHHREVFKGAA